MSAFIAYFDASGTDHDQPCIAVAGYVSTAERWYEFEQRWLERLKEEGLDYFHAKEIRRQLKNQRDVDELYADLIQIVKDSVERQFGCTVFRKALESISEAERKEWSLTGYSLGGRACAAQLRNWCHSWGAGSLPEMVFECGDTGQESLRRLLVRDGFPSPTFKPKLDTERRGIPVKGTVPLQAADLLAYECFKPIQQIERDGYLVRIRSQYQALNSIPGDPRAIQFKTMKQLYRLQEMRGDAIWIPSGPEEMPIMGIE